MSGQTEDAKVWSAARAELYQTDERKIADFEAAFPGLDLQRSEYPKVLGYYENGSTNRAWNHFVAGWDEAVYACGLSTKPVPTPTPVVGSALGENFSAEKLLDRVLGEKDAGALKPGALTPFGESLKLLSSVLESADRRDIGRGLATKIEDFLGIWGK